MSQFPHFLAVRSIPSVLVAPYTMPRRLIELEEIDGMRYNFTRLMRSFSSSVASTVPFAAVGVAIEKTLKRSSSQYLNDNFKSINDGRTEIHRVKKDVLFSKNRGHVLLSWGDNDVPTGPYNQNSMRLLGSEVAYPFISEPSIMFPSTPSNDSFPFNLENSKIVFSDTHGFALSNDDGDLWYWGPSLFPGSTLNALPNNVMKLMSNIGKVSAFRDGVFVVSRDGTKVGCLAASVSTSAFCSGTLDADLGFIVTYSGNSHQHLDVACSLDDFCVILTLKEGALLWNTTASDAPISLATINATKVWITGSRRMPGPVFNYQYWSAPNVQSFGYSFYSDPTQIKQMVNIEWFRNHLFHRRNGTFFCDSLVERKSLHVGSERTPTYYFTSLRYLLFTKNCKSVRHDCTYARGAKSRNLKISLFCSAILSSIWFYCSSII